MICTLALLATMPVTAAYADDIPDRHVEICSKAARRFDDGMRNVGLVHIKDITVVRYDNVVYDMTFSTQRRFICMLDTRTGDVWVDEHPQ